MVTFVEFGAYRFVMSWDGETKGFTVPRCRTRLGA